ncbi:hypothetical protein LINGRAHAP2_LOCUS5869 [Linum grandiflorum]
METLVTWIRIAGLPLEYYNDDGIYAVAQKVGLPIRIDRQTALVSRGKFARVCVQVNLSKPLFPVVGVEDNWLKVEYEGIPLICRKCWFAGHNSSSCLKFPNTDDDVMATVGPPDLVTESTSVEKVAISPKVQLDNLGATMVVPTRKPNSKRRGNRKTGNQRAQAKFEISVQKTGSNIIDSLEGDNRGVLPSHTTRATTARNFKLNGAIDKSAQNRFGILDPEVGHMEEDAAPEEIEETTKTGDTTVSNTPQVYKEADVTMVPPSELKISTGVASELQLVSLPISNSEMQGGATTELLPPTLGSPPVLGDPVLDNQTTASSLTEPMIQPTHSQNAPPLSSIPKGKIVTHISLPPAHPEGETFSPNSPSGNDYTGSGTTIRERSVASSATSPEARRMKQRSRSPLRRHL